MSIMKAPRPDRTLITHPEERAPHAEPFADHVRDILVALGDYAPHRRIVSDRKNPYQRQNQPEQHQCRDCYVLDQ